MKSMYDRNTTKWMSEELEKVGIKSLHTQSEVDDALKNKKGTSLVVVNSVCGCAAGSARPGVAISLQNDKIPDNLFTVFAGVDVDATKRTREHLKSIPPSSPSVFLFKNGELVFALPRSEIEGRNNVEVSERLVAAYNEHCSRPGPSVPVEDMYRAFGLK